MTPPTNLTSTTIDTLLERYLSLLDEYTTLRNSLNTLQSGIYQNIARANFSAERGIRYGQDHYDDRMQATRRVQIINRDVADGGNNTGDFVCSSGHYALSVVVHASGEAKLEEEDKKEKEEESPTHEQEDEKSHEPKSTQKGDEEPAPNKILISKSDPLRWFGLLTPLALRQAQSQAIQAVDDIIPKLATVNMAMAEVELEIRRARKKRAKAEATAEKEKLRQKEEEQVHRDLERLDLSSSAAAVDAQ